MVLSFHTFGNVRKLTDVTCVLAGCFKKGCTCGSIECLNTCEDPCYPHKECALTADPPTCVCWQPGGPPPPPPPPAPPPPAPPPADSTADAGGAADGSTADGGTADEGAGDGGTGEGGAGEGDGGAGAGTTLSSTETTPVPGSDKSTDNTSSTFANLTTTPLPNANVTNVTTTPPPSTRKTMDPEAAKALAGTVSAVVGACIGAVIAAGAAGAAAGPGAMAIIGQVQVLSQMGKIGGGGGALGAFSEGFEWANAELPFSFFPAGNEPDPDPPPLNPSDSGLRRWLETRRAKKGRPRPGETAEQADNMDCFNETFTSDDKKECYECGMINGIPLMDKGVVIGGSIFACFCVRSFAQLIVTKCMKKDPWDALLFPNWEGPLLITHWF